VTLLSLSKLAAKMTEGERAFYREGELGPGVAERSISSLPKIEKPQTWEFSAHPHHAERAGSHIDLRLGNPSTGVAHSFVLPKRTELPGPGEACLVVPTYDHTIPYMDYTGTISTTYGKGTVAKGRRTKAEVYHAEAEDGPGTKLRFNLYEGKAPEEFAIRRDQRGRWFLHNKTKTRGGRPDIPDFKPDYSEIDIDKVDPTDRQQALMPKLDGAHVVLDLEGGRAPRVFSYRVAQISPTGFIEHTHKFPELLDTKVPEHLDKTVVRAELMAIKKDGTPLPAETLGGILNSKVWESRRKQKELGVTLRAFPINVVRYRGKDLSDATFNAKLKVLREVEKAFGPVEVPPLAITPEEKLELLNAVKAKTHPLTREGVVLVEPEGARYTKAKVIPDYDVHIRAVHPAVSGETGKPHDRAGSVSYSWTPDGSIVGQFGGFGHEEGRDMLRRPDQYIGRVSKVRATRVFKKGNELGALFQPRFAGWHLDKGQIEKGAAMPFVSESQRKLFWAKVGRGEISRPVAEEWEAATPKNKKLPERAKTAGSVENLLFEHPLLGTTALSSLIGATIGAAAGGLSSKKDQPASKKVLKGALWGAGLGAIPGAALGTVAAGAKEVTKALAGPLAELMMLPVTFPIMMGEGVARGLSKHAAFVDEVLSILGEKRAAILPLLARLEFGPEIKQKIQEKEEAGRRVLHKLDRILSIGERSGPSFLQKMEES